MVGAGAAPARAVSASIAPPVIEKEARPGQLVQDTISYTNNGAEFVTVSVSIVDFDVDADYSVIEQAPGTQATTLAPYIRVTPTELRVAPKQQVFFRYRVETPEAFSHLRGMLYFLSRPEVPDARPGQVVLASRMGIPLYVESSKAVPARLDVNGIAWSRVGDARDALALDLDVVNRGERIIRPTGVLEVKSGDGRFRKSFSFNDGKLPVFPGSTRRLNLQFGPVPGGELFLQLRFEDSSRTWYASEYRLPG